MSTGRKVAVTLGALVVLALAIGVVALIVIDSGALPWTTPSAPHSAEQTLAVGPTAPLAAAMPDVVGKDLQAEGTKLARMGLAVRVVLAARHTGLISNPESSNDGTELVLPAIDTPFPAAKGGSAPKAWGHIIARQTPDAGTPLTDSSKVVLYAGRHVGANPESTWYDTHSSYADSKGPSYCLECHEYNACVECHMRYRTDQTGSTPGSEEATSP